MKAFACSTDRQITVADLRIGEIVRVKGWYNDNATMIVARQIIVESEG